MKILFVGEASFVHNTLQRQMRAMGHEVTLMSDGNAWHNSPRDIDLGRDLTKGKWGGVKVVKRLLCALPKLRGYDIVQITNPNCIPLRLKWNARLLRYLAKYNKHVVMGCFGDDPVIMRTQNQGALAYCDTYWDGKPQLQAENALRLKEQNLPEYWLAEGNAIAHSARLVACLYEYYKCYEFAGYKETLSYLPLPIDLPEKSAVKVKGCSYPLRVLVGIQTKRDYMKGAAVIGGWLDELAKEYPEKLQVIYAKDVPYNQYCELLNQADVLVDQLYSYTPAMNALAAMARGTVVIGGGEEEYYRFIGEDKLRPIINVRPDNAEESKETLRQTLLKDGVVEQLSIESRLFVEKHHDARKVAMQYIQLYEEILNK